MTSEVRTLIELTDILGLEIDCQACHARFVYPLSSARKAIHKCPNCNENWFITERSTDAPKQLLELLEIIDALAQTKDIFPKIQLALRPLN